MPVYEYVVRSRLAKALNAVLDAGAGPVKAAELRKIVTAEAPPAG